MVSVRLHSKRKGELNRFLSEFYDTDMEIFDDLKWEKKYQNPIEVTDLIGAFIDNYDNFDIRMWLSLDRDIFIRISERNGDEVIRYLFERFPY